MKAFYNDIEPYAVNWLQNLALIGEISPGDVSGASITELEAWQLVQYDQAHFFCGIGGWPLALRLAGYPNLKCWTGSCPCQPFSGANVAHGGGKGTSDPRHLFPAWFSLIQSCRPSLLFGEQVPNAIKWGWLDEVFDSLEGEGYTCGAYILPAHSVDADHERKRLYWYAYTSGAGREGYQPIERFPQSAPEAQPLFSDPFLRARRTLAGDHSAVLFGDGVPVSVERCATKGYGNAIVPQVAAVFVRSVMEAIL